MSWGNHRIVRLPTRLDVDAGEAEGFLDAAPHTLEVHHERLRMGLLTHTLHHLQECKPASKQYITCRVQRINTRMIIV